MFIIIILQAIVKMSTLQDKIQEYAKAADRYYAVNMSKDASTDEIVAAMRDFNELKSGLNDPYFHPRLIWEFNRINANKTLRARANLIAFAREKLIALAAKASIAAKN